MGDLCGEENSHSYYPCLHFPSLHYNFLPLSPTFRTVLPTSQPIKSLCWAFRKGLLTRSRVDQGRRRRKQPFPTTTTSISKSTWRQQQHFKRHHHDPRTLGAGQEESNNFFYIIIWVFPYIMLCINYNSTQNKVLLDKKEY